MATMLNPIQRSAVQTIDTQLLVLAGAGSGKTRVITQKVAYLIETCRLPAKHIAALTFTNKAAREMKERLRKITDRNSIKGLRVSTFHTLGLDIIRRELKALGYKSGFSIYDETDSVNLVKELMRRDFGDPGNQADKFRWRISQWKNSLITPEDAIANASNTGEQVAAKLYLNYNHHLKTYNAVDFDDLIMLPVQLFRDRNDILLKWRERIRYLLVDEYQDTNATQYELVKQIVGGRNGLTVVGDDDQSIYAWRGAQPENLALLRDDFPQLKIVKLEQNYRSTGTILKAANILIANNTHLFEKRLWSELGPGAPISVICLRNEEQEAEQVVAQLLHHRFQKRTKFSDYAVLYRGNYQSRLFERVLREHDIPYYLSGGISFFAYAEIKDIMAYLRLVANPDDDNAFLRIANTPRRGIGPGTLEKLTKFANRQQCSLFTACWSDLLRSNVNTSAAVNLRRFAEWVANIELSIDEQDPISAAERLIVEMDYETWLLDNSKTPEAAERRIENVKELINWLRRLGNNEPDSSLGDLVAKLTLMDTLDRDSEDERENRVQLMTLHAAKGLEFPHVFLVGVEENLLPHRSSIDEDNIEEERRLAYVGITRAQTTLTITLAGQRKRFGEVVDCEPSRFLEELPQDSLNWQGQGVEMPEEERQERGKAHLENLRNMLSG
ncbi:DNA helicase Rep [Pseudomonadota bacterium]